ncbi:MAG: AAA family ATPase [Acetobacteraceae bacterium]
MSGSCSNKKCYGGNAVKIFSVAIKNFRRTRPAKLTLPDHAVLIGDDNTGKSSVFEAIDLALGQNRNSPPASLLREDYRVGGKGKRRTLANLRHRSPAKIERLRRVLHGKTLP